MESHPLYNSRIFDTYLKLLIKRYPQVPIDRLLEGAGMSLPQVTDPGHWFSQEQADRFHALAVQMTGNPAIAREAGRYAASPEALGPVRQYLLGLVGPARGFVLVNRAAALFTRSSVFESKIISQNRVEIVVRFREGVSERPYQCANRMGSLEAFVTLFTHRLPEIVHTECIFQGGEACRYEISWDRGAADRWREARRFGILGGAAIALAVLFLHPQFFVAAAACILPLVLFLVLFAEHAEKKEVGAALDNLRDSTEKQLAQMQSHYDNTLLVNEIGQAISSRSDIDQILADVAGLLQKRLNYDRGVILMADSAKANLRVRASYGFSERSLLAIDEITIPLGRPEGLLASSFLEQKPFLVNDISTVSHLIPPALREVARLLDIHSFIICPIICEGDSLGVLAVDVNRIERPLLQSDLSLLMGVAPVIGISIHNAELLAKEKQQSAALKVANAELEAFCYTVAHDLRAPLRAISGYGAIIEEEGAAGFDAYFGRIGAAVVRMGDLIDDLLSLYRVSRCDLEHEEVDLSYLAREVAKELMRREPGRVVDFVIADGVTVVGDRPLLQVALENLLGNAWKYTGKKSRGVVEFGEVDVEGTRACFVRDNGTGFDMCYVDKLFQPFQRLHRDDEFEGTGIGLATVHRIVSRHGGRIWAEAEEGKGAAFYFTITRSHPALYID